MSKSLNNWHIRLAANAVAGAGVIAYPTEAVYGLGCNPWDAQAVSRILELKRRPQSKGLIVVAASLAQLYSLVDFSQLDSIQSLLETWPGHVTWIVPANSKAPEWVRGKSGEIAVRVTAHPLLSQLCQLSGPLVSTSANISNTPAARTGQQVRNYFRDSLDFILPGKLGVEGRPSEIRHARSGRILRQA
jgi:L-threonylcarbamoyladenylate synthase